MSEPTDLKAYKGSKKELCMYCGSDAHATPLACPRILGVDIDPEYGCVVGLTFNDYRPPDPPAAA